MGSLTQLQKSIITGSLLGDGYMRILPGRSNALLEINHSIKQKDYVDWKYLVLKSVVGGEPKARTGNGKRIAYRFYTKQLPELTEMLGQFYKDSKKVIPEELELDSVSLAVWFMDDGGKCGEKNVYLNTQQFDLDDQDRLSELLKGLGLEVKANRDKKYWRLRFLSSSLPKLRSLINDMVIPSMKYKLGNWV